MKRLPICPPLFLGGWGYSPYDTREHTRYRSLVSTRVDARTQSELIGGTVEQNYSATIRRTPEMIWRFGPRGRGGVC